MYAVGIEDNVKNVSSLSGLKGSLKNGAKLSSGSLYIIKRHCKYSNADQLILLATISSVIVIFSRRDNKYEIYIFT